MWASRIDYVDEAGPRADVRRGCRKGLKSLKPILFIRGMNWVSYFILFLDCTFLFKKEFRHRCLCRVLDAVFSERRSQKDIYLNDSRRITQRRWSSVYTFPSRSLVSRIGFVNHRVSSNAVRSSSFSHDHGHQDTQSIYIYTVYTPFLDPYHVVVFHVSHDFIRLG